MLRTEMTASRARGVRVRRASIPAAGAAALAGAALLAAIAWVVGAVPPAAGSPGRVSGRASVHLVRFLDEVSETDRARWGPLHDVRLRLEHGFVVLVRRGGDFAALLPIEARPGSPDSLQYFWYLERSPFLWVIPRGSDRGVHIVPDGGEIHVNEFVLRWGRGGDLGWIYFPDVPENRGVSFSVVSGGSVDKVDPRGTRYWVELGDGSPGGGGF
jgi:hypothetical protein